MLSFIGLTCIFDNSIYDPEIKLISLGQLSILLFYSGSDFGLQTRNGLGWVEIDPDSQKSLEVSFENTRSTLSQGNKTLQEVLLSIRCIRGAMTNRANTTAFFWDFRFRDSQQ
jgi:hypothetical protein